MNTYTLHRTSLADQTKITVAEKLPTSNYIITDRYIFTLEGLSSEVKGSTIYLHGCRIRRMNHDGSDSAVIAETDVYDFKCSEFSSDEILIDSYEDAENCYLALAFCVTDEDGKTVNSSDTLILDTVSSEFIVSEYIS